MDCMIPAQALFGKNIPREFLDSNGEPIFYKFDWDDGTDSGWIGPYNSGQTINASHIWNSKGNYAVKVNA